MKVLDIKLNSSKFSIYKGISLDALDVLDKDGSDGTIICFVDYVDEQLIGDLQDFVNDIKNPYFFVIKSDMTENEIKDWAEPKSKNMYTIDEIGGGIRMSETIDISEFGMNNIFYLKNG